MTILLLKSTTEPKCPTALPFCSPWIQQTHWLTWEAQLLTHSLGASPGELAHSVLTCTAQWKCLGDMRATFPAGRFYSNHTLKEASLSPVLSQPWLGHQISSSSSLAGVLQHYHFLPQPSLPLQFLQVEISSTPAPYRQIPSCFHSGVNRKRGGHIPEP